jgi:hypothetical protein
MKRLLIAAACGALLSLGCENQPNNQPGARTANKPPITDQPRTNPGEPAPGAPRTDETIPPPADPTAANPQPGAPASK